MSESVIEIEAGRPWWRGSAGEVWARRDLVRLLLRKDLLASYKQSLLGPAWFVIQPLVTSLVFGLLFGRFAKLSPPGVPPFLYYLGGYVLWNYFHANVSAVAGSLSANAAILRKIYFPRAIVPLVAAGVSTVHFLINYAVFLLLYAGYLLFAGWSSPLDAQSLLLVPLIPLFVALVGTGIGTWLAAWTVIYRDLRIGLPVILNLWMFATPIIWPLRLVPADLRWLFALNPMTPAVELHRAVFLGTPVPEPALLLIGGAVGAVALVGGVVIFNRTQGTFVDTL